MSQRFSFEVVTVNRRGEIIKKETKQAQYFTENPNDGRAFIKNQNDEHERLLRGGSWSNDPGGCRSAYRHRYDPEFYNYDIA